MNTEYSKKKKKASQKCIILEKTVKEIKNRLKKSAMWIIVKTEEGKIYKTPASMRGNRTYAYYQAKRLNEIQQEINKRFHTDGRTKTNSIFLTLTTGYNKRSEESIIQSWRLIKMALPKFVQRIKKIGVTDYIAGVEAYRAGGCHAHAHLILNRNIEMEEIDEVYRVSDYAIRNTIKTTWASCLRCALEKAHCDVQAVHSKELAGYITKELKKVNACEDALKRYDKGKASESDEQKILAFYFAVKESMRMLRVSKGLGTGKDTEPRDGKLEVQDDDLINHSNKSSKLVIVLTRRQVLNIIKWEHISPYSGEVEPDTQEWIAYNAIFESKKEMREESMVFNEYLQPEEYTDIIQD